LTIVSVRQPAGATTEEDEALVVLLVGLLVRALVVGAALLGEGVLEASFEGEGESDGVAEMDPAGDAVLGKIEAARVLEAAAAPRSDTVSDDEPPPVCARATNTPASRAKATKTRAPAVRTRPRPPRRRADGCTDGFCTDGRADACCPGGDSPDDNRADASLDRWRAFRSLIHSPGGSPTAWDR
jgi:hypothetical protein